MAATHIPVRLHPRSSHHLPFRIIGASPQLSQLAPRRRWLSSDARKSSAYALNTESTSAASAASSPLAPIDASLTSSAVATAIKNPLSCLPLSVLIRNIVITTFSTHRILLNPSLKILTAIAYSENPILRPSSNPILKFILKRTLFKHFCAGETPAEIRTTLAGLRSWGIEGVLLCWAREIEKRGDDAGYEEASGKLVEKASDAAQINEWVSHTLQAIRMASARDSVCIKLTGAGALNLKALASNVSPTPTLAQGLEDICREARERDVTLAVDAEQSAIQEGIDAWTLGLARRYNDSRAFVVNTYQTYLKATPQKLADHLALAQRDRFCLGIKLVRGAYLASDPRHLLHDTKEDTDACFDRCAEAIMRREWHLLPTPSAPADTAANSITPTTPGTDPAESAVSSSSSSSSATSATTPTAFPNVCLMLATHNLASTQKAMTLRAAQAAAGQARVPMVYAQLVGMADHVSCELVAARRAAELATTTVATRGIRTAGVNQTDASTDEAGMQVERPRPYKYIVWGSLDECLKYLVRRAEENRDSMARTMEGKGYQWRELRRRVFG